MRSITTPNLRSVGLTAIGAYHPPAAAPVGKRGARVRWRVGVARARILSRADDTAYLPRRCAVEEAAECRPASGPMPIVAPATRPSSRQPRDLRRASHATFVAHPFEHATFVAHAFEHGLLGAAARSSVVRAEGQYFYHIFWFFTVFVQNQKIW